MSNLKRLFLGALVVVVVATSAVATFYLLTPANQIPSEQTTYTFNQTTYTYDTTLIRLDGVFLMEELATTTAAQQQGLTDRDAMPADNGMLFEFQHEGQGQWGFWMNEMRFPLDIIWFNVSKQVVFIEQDLQPCSLNACPVYTPPVRMLNILEVNAGFVAANGVRLGDSFSFV